jgi:hypothetical protein
VEGTHVAQIRLFPLVLGAKIEAISATSPAIARWNPPRPAKLLKRNDRELAERVGFVPDVPALINGLGLIGSSRNRQIH